VLTFRKILLAACLCLAALGCGAQIVNRLNVDPDTFQSYAWGRMQQYSPDNLPLADSLYAEGVRQDNFRIKCLGLSLEFPVRYALGEYDRMDEAVAEIKELIADRKDCRSFYYATLHEYCQYLVHIGRSSDAMLEARAMERLASSEQRPLGKMYAYRIVGLIHSYRDNHYLAVKNLTSAVRFCKESKNEQDLPNIYLLIARECIKMGDFPKALDYCTLAGEYQELSAQVRINVTMTLAYYYYARNNTAKFLECYTRLIEDPVYRPISDLDSQLELDIFDLILKDLPQEALAKADSLTTPIGRYTHKHGLYAQIGHYPEAYRQLDSLMVQKDSIYIKVQNEDLAILDAEMNNAQLRYEAQQLKTRNQNTILIGFLVMFGIAFFSMLYQQWHLRSNLDRLKQRNAEVLRARRIYRQALDAKESENAVKIKILQNRKSNTFKL
jgi:tetratricopeptide (TPR) repeat protein